MLKKINLTRKSFPYLLMGLLALSFCITSCNDDEVPQEEVRIPVILSFSPESGEAGDEVTITGTDLGNASSVRFGQTDATIVSNSATEIVAEVPEAATTGKITVVTAGGTAVSSGDFEVITMGAPTVTEVSTISAQAGETFVISGTEMEGVSSVEIGGEAAEVISTTESTVEVRVAEGTPLGLNTITVSSEGGSATTSTDAIRFYVVDVFEDFSDTFDREELTFTSGGHAEITTYGPSNTIADATMLPNEIDGNFYHLEGVNDPNNGGSYNGMIGFGKQEAGSLAHFFEPGSDPEEYYFNFQMHANDPEGYDGLLVSPRIRFESGDYDVDADDSFTDEHLEFHPTAEMLEEMGFTPNEDGWYTLSIPFDMFTEGGPKGGASWNDYDIDQMTRFVFASRRSHEGEWSLSIDNVFITRGGPYNFSNPE